MSEFYYDPEADDCYRGAEFKGFVGYRIGAKGNIESRWKRLWLGPRKGIGRCLGNEWHILSPGRRYDGHLHVSLVKDGVVSQFQVHRLVLEAFVGPCPEGMECLHRDGVSSHNDLGNLKWGSHQENMEDQIRHGVTAIGSRNGNSKLTEEKVLEARRMFATGQFTKKELATVFGVCRNTMTSVLNLKKWNHVT